MTTHWICGLTATQQDKKRHVWHELAWCEKKIQEKVQGVRRWGNLFCREGSLICWEMNAEQVDVPGFSGLCCLQKPTGRSHFLLAAFLRGRELTAVRGNKVCFQTRTSGLKFPAKHFPSLWRSNPSHLQIWMLPATLTETLARDRETCYRSPPRSFSWGHSFQNPAPDILLVTPF